MNTLETEIKRPVDKKGLAEFFSVTTRTIDNEMRRGMPYVKIGNRCRFTIDEVTQWLKAKAR